MLDKLGIYIFLVRINRNLVCKSIFQIGSEDLRAPEGIYGGKPRGIFRPVSDFPTLSSTWDTWPYGKSIFDDPSHAAERVNVPGYRYDPLHRDIYGYSPRKIFPHNYGYSPLDRYRPGK